MDPSSKIMCELIGSNGIFKHHELEKFLEGEKLSKCGLSYVVVSIIGPQSSGKSTLLNQLFGTNFKEMNAYEGRNQTTKGIWLARSSSIVEPTTLVMDLEGTDSSEREEDDTAFEKQSAVFALAVSDVVLINMWLHDIGRKHAANIPLLSIVFQARMRLFRTRKTTLMFVIRDNSKTPLENLEQKLKKDVQMIWDSLNMAQAKKDITQVFNVEVVALSSYEDKDNQEFKKQVSSLRQRFSNCLAPGGWLAEERQEVVPASGLSCSMHKIWQTIKENKDLDLPAHSIMVATVRCQQIANEKYEEFINNKDWLQMEMESRFGLVSGLGKNLGYVIGKCLSKYDSEVAYFDTKVASNFRMDLHDKLQKLVGPALKSNLRHLRSKTLQNFKEEFDRALTEGQKFSSASCICKDYFMLQFDKDCQVNAVIKQGKSIYWDATLKSRSKLLRDIDAYIGSVFDSKLKEIQSQRGNQMERGIRMAGDTANVASILAQIVWVVVQVAMAFQS